MVLLDQEAAGPPTSYPARTGRLDIDFHSLRHTCISLLDKTGASLKGAMQLARHSDPGPSNRC
jgi:hypothetical protein